MVIRCMANRGGNSPIVLPENENLPLSNFNYIVSTEGVTIDSQISEYKLTIDKEYEVYGMLIYRSDLKFLIADDDNVPCFFSSELFVVVKNELPVDLNYKEYRLWGEDVQIIAYKALTETYSALTNLIKHQRNAVFDFMEYKKYLHEWGQYT